MTQQEINEAIAQACGFVGSDKWGHWYKTTNGIARDCPDYCNDLNEMHEAEEAIIKNEDLLRRYEDGLYREVYPAWSASARQRAEAFVKTIGKMGTA